MEALFASCSEEFQDVRRSTSALKAEFLAHDRKLKDLGNTIGQQLSILGQRISALEARPKG
eukprot:10343987-Alexandrium_andersonii.AAC.1